MSEYIEAVRRQLSEEGWLSGVAHCPSPNCNARPAGTVVSLLVIHNISLPPGEYGGGHVAELFTNQLDQDAHPYFATVAELQVSAHFLIERDGSLTQFVGTQQRAWHAGISSFEGVQNCNDFSVGIELEGCDDSPYRDAQYAVLAELTEQLLERYPALNRKRIVGHSDIAPGRKTDPGPSFDWSRYFKLLCTASR